MDIPREKGKNERIRGFGESYGESLPVSKGKLGSKLGASSDPIGYQSNLISDYDWLATSSGPLEATNFYREHYLVLCAHLSARRAGESHSVEPSIIRLKVHRYFREQ